MPNSINLIFGVHNHQPVGNFEGVFNRAHHQCYRPFVETLYRFPEVKTTFHFSGSLIDWLLQRDSQILQKVKTMVRRGQAEILTGGYYEPIFPIIPERDLLGQINLLSKFIQDYFEYQPKGCWLTERVWEPNLAGPLTSAGVKYTLLDDFHFINAGIKKEDLRGYYLTTEKDKPLALFPISKDLRYIIPFSQPSQAIAYLKGLASKEGNRALVIVDDGEKFGLWPGTYKWVYREKWLEKFLQLLIKNKDWLKTKTISEYMQEYPALARQQIPAASYEEMMSWSGGSFLNFFSKYPEANHLHKRMLYVSNKLNQARPENREAKKYLYMSQCNCPYWHGVFGGIYLKHLRHFAYRNLIHAQSLLERTTQPQLEALDLDQDGQEEIILKNAQLNLFLSPAQGGSILEIDYLPKQNNITDAMTRKKEAYHEKIKAKLRMPFAPHQERAASIHDLLTSKEKGLGNFLIYDTYRRASLIDHFLSPQETSENFKSNRYTELGDFIQGAYTKKRGPDGSIILQRQGNINYQGRQIPLGLSKEVSLSAKGAEIFIKYRLENLGRAPLKIIFGAEFNIFSENDTAPSGLRCSLKSEEQHYSLKQDMEASQIENVCLRDAQNNTETCLYFDQPANLWAGPLQTISASEEGFERNFQQTTALVHWPIELNEAWETKLRLVAQPFTAA